MGGRKDIQPVKNMGYGGGGHWLVRMEWRPAEPDSRCACLC